MKFSFLKLFIIIIMYFFVPLLFFFFMYMKYLKEIFKIFFWTRKRTIIKCLHAKKKKKKKRKIQLTKKQYKTLLVWTK